MATPERQKLRDPSPGGGAPGVPAVVAPPSAPLSGPPRRVRGWVWALGLILAGGVGTALYLRPWVAGPVPVVVETVVAAPVTRVLAVNGKIAALRSVDVRAQVNGRLVAVRVAEGDTVQTGQELARIDSAAAQAQVRQAVAGLDAALVSLAQARADLARAQAMGATVAAITRETAARAAQSAEQEVARTTALVDQARTQLDYHTLRAPLSGTVLALHVEAGESVDPAVVLLTIADLGQLIVETDVDEAYAAQIRAGLPAVLQLAGEADLRDGHVARVSQQVDASTGGLAVDLGFDGPVSAPVGLTVTVNIVVDSRDAALTVPRAAIQTAGTETAVFIVREGAAHRRPVSVIDWPAARLIVTDGLTPGDALIVDATGIADGQAVRVGAP